MKILLISVFTGFPEMPPLNICMLGSYLESVGHEVKVVDTGIGEDPYIIVRYFKPDVIGISSTTQSIKNAYRIADNCRENGYYTVIGGVHASAMPYEAINHADAVIIGEGENRFIELIKSKERGVFTTNPINDINNLPILGYHLINMPFYTTIRDRIFNSILSYVLPFDKVAITLTSRGCPYRCTFCYNSKAKVPYRFKSPEKVIEEIIYLKNNYNIDSICIMEDDLLINKKRLEKICDLMIENKLDIYWSANARSTDVTEDIVELIKQAGCVQLAFGFESANQRILDILNKKITVEDSINAIEICDKYGIVTQGSLMIGNPTETVKEIQTTVEFAKKYNIDGGLGSAICTPYPGTVLWEWAIKNNIITSKVNYDMLCYANLVVSLSDIPPNIFNPIVQQTRVLFNNLFLMREKTRINKVLECKKNL